MPVGFPRPFLVQSAAGLFAVLLLAVASPVPSLHGQPRQLSAKQALLEGVTRPAHVIEAPLTAARRPTRDALPYVPGHIVVKFAPQVTAQMMGRMASRAGARQVVIPHHADFTYVQIGRDEDPFAAADRLRGQPGVVYAEPDARVFTTYTPNDPLYKYQWHLHKLDMERTWRINEGSGPNVIVAVIDSGVAYLNRGAFARAPELEGTALAPGFDFVWDDNEPVDMDGHGTHVAGTIAQATNNNIGPAGMAFNVTLMPIKAIYGDWDEELDAPFPHGASTVARALRFAADNGAKVINMSLGSFLPNTATRDAMQYAIDKGAFLAIAAGNDGDGDNRPSYPAVYAKDMDGAIAVGAVDFNLARAPYSNVNDYVEIVAPGGNVDADLNEDGYGDGVLQQTLDFDAVRDGNFNEFVYLFSHGTSMAVPHVSALAALLIDQGVRNPRAVEAAIKKFATDLGPAGRDNETGYGLINPRATIRGLGLRR